MKKMNICKCNLKNLESKITPNIIIKIYTNIYMNYEIDVDYGAKCEKILHFQLIHLKYHFIKNSSFSITKLLYRI